MTRMSEFRLDSRVTNLSSGRLEAFVISTAFFLSGAAALVFEVVWFHRSGLVFGNSVWSTSLVLSGFMAGLGIGNALVARSAHRIRHFLRTYALLEFIVALQDLCGREDVERHQLGRSGY